MARQTTGGQMVNNADGQRARSASNKSNRAIQYEGIDFGGYVDFGAIHKLLVEALSKVPADQLPAGAENWTMTLVLHPTEEEGSAWAQDDNPYKTWGWMILLPAVLQAGILGLLATHGAKFFA